MPVKTAKGSYLVNVFSESVGHHRLCDILEWQEGRMKYRREVSTFYEVGKLMGSLQANTIKTKHRNYWHAEGLVGNNATLGGFRSFIKSFLVILKESSC